MTAPVPKYAPSPTAANTRVGTANEFRRISLSIDAVIYLLGALNVPVEVGPNDSAGAGYRTLKVPNA